MTAKSLAPCRDVCDEMRGDELPGPWSNEPPIPAPSNLNGCRARPLHCTNPNFAGCLGKRTLHHFSVVAISKSTMTASPFFSEPAGVLEVAISEYTGSVSGVTVALGTVTALCARSGAAKKDTSERQNNIVLAGTEKIMSAIIGRKGI